MARDWNTDRYGSHFGRSKVEAVWEQARAIRGYDPDKWRCDICGKVMKRSEYGNTNSEYGWELDHIVPVSRGGSDELENLQPLQWETNREKADQFPWSCP